MKTSMLKQSIIALIFLVFASGISLAETNTWSSHVNESNQYIIKGIVKSDQGVLLKDVAVTFFDLVEEKIIGNCLSDFAGKYTSGPLFKKGQKIEVQATKRGYGETTQSLEIKNTLEIIENFVLETRTYTVGFITDSITGLPVSGVEMSFYDGNGRLITTQKTNQRGYYEFDTPFIPGQMIRVRADGPKPEGVETYVPKEQILRIVLPGAENRLDFTLPKWIDSTIKLGLRVYTKKKKPLAGVEVFFVDKSPQRLMVSENGEILLSLRSKPGDQIEIRLLKAGFREKVLPVVLSRSLQYVEIVMEKR